MKLSIEGTPEEIKNVFQAIGDKEHADMEPSHFTVDGASLAHALTGQLDSLRGQGARRDRGQR